MENWVRVDLHSHTLNGIGHDKKNEPSLYTHAKFLEVVQSQDVQIKAVTNHNTLVLSDHIKHALICSLIGVTYIPGVEIDCNFTGKRFHGVLLFNPKDDIIKISNQINQTTKKKQSDSSLDFVEYQKSDFEDVIKDGSFIFIVHACKTEGVMPNQTTSEGDTKNLEWVVSSIKNNLAAPFLFENTKDYHAYSVMDKICSLTENEQVRLLSHRSIINSDYKFDNNTDRQKIVAAKAKYCIFSLPTYRGLELAIRNYDTRFSEEKDIIQRVNYISQIQFSSVHNPTFDLHGTISLSPSLNVIIGPSGSGKTLLLNEIFRSVNPGKNLQVSSKKESEMAKRVSTEDLYFGKTGGKDIVKSITYSKSPLKTVEIPKIYNLLLKAVDGTDVASLFGVTRIPSAEACLSDYSKNLMAYFSLLTALRAAEKKGQSSLESIYSTGDFLLANASSDVQFRLASQDPSRIALENLRHKIDSIDRALNKRQEYLDYLKSLESLLPSESLPLLKQATDSFSAVVGALGKQKEIFQGQYALEWCKIREQQIVAANINKINQKLGAKASEIADKKLQKSFLDHSLSDAIRDALKAKFQSNTVDCAFPLTKIKSAILAEGSNKYARLSTSYLPTDFQGKNLSESRIFVQAGHVAVFKNSGSFNLLTPEGGRALVSQLFDDGLNLGLLVVTDIPKTTQLSVNGQWVDQNEINPGSLAKIYMDYYFNDLLKRENPNVIFIDQPENDVDKTFITKVLSAFIRTHKLSIQFIVTTHDPIIAVNSDANLIIQAVTSGKKAIAYQSFPMEDVNPKTFENVGTDAVANTLDGGKMNVFNRNQIYGGSIND